MSDWTPDDIEPYRPPEPKLESKTDEKPAAWAGRAQILPVESCDGRWQSLSLYRQQMAYVSLLLARQVAVLKGETDRAIALTILIRESELRLATHGEGPRIGGLEYLEACFRVVGEHADRHDLWREDEM